MNRHTRDAARQSHPAHVPELLVRVAASAPDRVLVSEPEYANMTAAELLQDVTRTAGTLRELGIARSELVAIECHELACYEFIRIYLAVVWLGAIPVLAPEPDFAPASELGANRLVVRRSDGDPASLGLDELVSSATPIPEPATADDGVLDVVFTSGTTGAWKPVVSTHEQWLKALPANVLNATARVKVVAQGGVPWAASAGVHGVILHQLAGTNTNVWARTPEEFIAHATERQAVELHQTPHSLQAMLKRCDLIETAWASRVQVIKTVGGMVPARLGRHALEVFENAKLVCLYGLTEAGSALSLKLFDPEAPDSIGRPLPGTQIRIVDENGAPVPEGGTGSIQVRRTDVPPLSYFGPKQPDGTFLDGGWISAGDLGRIGSNGEVELIGRSKELLFLSVGRTAPHVIEAGWADLLPNGVDYAAVGVPTSGSWDQIAAFVAGDPGDPLVRQTLGALRAIEGALRPDHIRTIEVLPRTATGKVRRGELAKRLSSSAEVGDASWT